MSLKDAAAAEAVLKALHDAIGDQLKQVRAGVQEGLDVAQLESGVRQIAAALPDGTAVAKISLTDPKPSAVVADEAAFLAWVRDNHPTEIERRFVTEVRGAFRTRLLDQMTAAGVPDVVDTATGVVDTVPGVEIRATRARSHSVRFEKGGREAIAAAWQAGQLTHLVLPALEPGTGSEGAAA